MNKRKIVSDVSDELLIDPKETKDVIESFLEKITESLGNGDNVIITGFGSFNLVKRVARRAKNPRTGEDVLVPEKTVVSFNSSGKLKDRVND